MKLSHPLKNSQKDDHGTRYMGEGSWVVPNHTCAEDNVSKNLSLLEDYRLFSAAHFWEVRLTKGDDKQTPYQISYTAMDIEKKVVMQQKDELLAL